MILSMRLGILFRTAMKLSLAIERSVKEVGLLLFFRTDLKVKQSKLDDYESFEHCIVDQCNLTNNKAHFSL